MIDAMLVASGVGLPLTWRNSCGNFIPRYRNAYYNPLDPSDPQTAFGLAMQLDEWEGNGPHSHRVEWVERLGRAYRREGYAELLLTMTARIEFIGRDHAIRRELDWEMKAGSLASLRWDHEHWYFTDGDRDHCFVPSSIACTFSRTSVPALAGITEPREAQRAIYEEVCDGTRS